MKITYKKPNDLTPYAHNPRINDGAVEAVANSIREFGFLVPIVVDKENVVVTGHTRLKAAIALGLTEVPTVDAGNLSEQQIKAFRLTDNKTAELAEWDFDKLTAELEGLPDFDMSDFGFDSLDFKPVGADEVPRLDVIEKKPIVCPHCGHEFEVSTTLLRK